MRGDLNSSELNMYRAQAGEIALTPEDEIDPGKLANLNTEVARQVARDELGLYTDRQLERVQQSVEIPAELLKRYYAAIKKNGGRPLATGHPIATEIATLITIALDVQKEGQSEKPFNTIRSQEEKDVPRGN